MFVNRQSVTAVPYDRGRACIVKSILARQACYDWNSKCADSVPDPEEFDENAFVALSGGSLHKEGRRPRAFRSVEVPCLSERSSAFARQKPATRNKTDDTAGR